MGRYSLLNYICDFDSFNALFFEITEDFDEFALVDRLVIKLVVIFGTGLTASRLKSTLGSLTFELINP